MGKKPDEGDKTSANRYILKLESKKGKKMMANFGGKKIPQGATSKRFYPVFNIGSPSFASAFVCENLRLRKKHKDESVYLKELQERIKKYQLKPIDLKDAKPRARSTGNYCAVCKCHYKQDYFKHIKSKPHKEIVSRDCFQSYLLRLEKYYAKRIEIKEKNGNQGEMKGE